MHFFYDKTFFTEGFGLTEVLWNLHIVDFIADLALKMRMRMHISVKAGIFSSMVSILAAPCSTNNFSVLYTVVLESVGISLHKAVCISSIHGCVLWFNR